MKYFVVYFQEYYSLFGLYLLVFCIDGIFHQIALNYYLIKVSCCTSLILDIIKIFDYLNIAMIFSCFKCLISVMIINLLTNTVLIFNVYKHLNFVGIFNCYCLRLNVAMIFNYFNQCLIMTANWLIIVILTFNFLSCLGFRGISSLYRKIPVILINLD